MCKETIIRDPIHGFISLNHYDCIKELIETPYFQRLRRLSQLGVSVYVYPSAVHNRFNHSLGVMELFVQMFDHLFKDRLAEDKIKEMRLIGIISALLHDIGHGPFSHVSESVFGFKHEDISVELIKKTEIKDIINKVSDVEEVINVIRKRASEENVILSQLVSSQLDADRLDYLARDAYFTGIGFGNVDINRIIKTLFVYDNPESQFHNYALVQYKGIHSLESYIVTRHLMYQAIYYHKTTRCVERLIEAILKRAKDLDVLSKEFEFMNGKVNIDYYTMLDDHLIFTLIRQWLECDDSILKDLSNRIINRKLLKAIDLTFEMNIHDPNIHDSIKDYFNKNNLEPTYYYLYDKSEEHPYKPSSHDDSTSVQDAIFILKNNKPQEISLESDIINALTKKKYNERIFVPKEHYDKVIEILNRKNQQ